MPMTRPFPPEETPAVHPPAEPPPPYCCPEYQSLKYSDSCRERLSGSDPAQKPFCVTNTLFVPCAKQDETKV